METGVLFVLMSIKKVVIPAAGLGTRFLPATKASPKEMLPIVDKPVIQYIVEEAVSSGADHIIIVTGQFKRAIEDHFDSNFELEERLKMQGKDELLSDVRRISDLADFTYVRQKEPKGNGHAVLVTRKVVGNEPFAVLWGDDVVKSDIPCLAQMMEIYEKYQGPVLAVMEVDQSEIGSYGVIAGLAIDENVYKVSSIVEKPKIGEAPSNLAAVKAYILTPDIFDILEAQTEGTGGEIWLTDAINELAKRRDVYAYRFSGTRYDCGKKLDFLKATIDFALEREEFNGALKNYLRERLG